MTGRHRPTSTDSATRRSAPGTAAADGRLGRETPTLLLACAAQFMVVLDVTIVNVALPSIRTDLHFSASSLQWVVNAYTLTFAGLLLLAGRAADLFGRRRVFLVGLAVFGVASLLGGLAQDGAVLTAARALQGVGGAIISPASLAIITSRFTDPRARQRAVGFWGAIAGVGGAFGSLFGGLLTGYLSWRWVLFVNLPVVVAVVVLTPRYIRETRAALGHCALDVPGALSVTVGLVALVYSIVRTTEVGWGSWKTLVGLAAAAVLLGGFVRIEQRTAAPLLPLRILRVGSVAGANLVAVLTGAALFSMFYFLTLYLQEVHGYSALKGGFAFLLPAFAIILGSRVSARVLRRTPPGPPLLAGLLVLATGQLLLSRVGPESSFGTVVLPASLVATFGMGLALVPLTVAAVSGVPRDDNGIASGLINMSRQVGGALGLAVLATLATARTQHVLASGRPGRGLARLALSDGYTRAFLFEAGIALLAAAVALVTLVLRRPPAAPSAPAPVDAPVAAAPALAD